MKPARRLGFSPSELTLGTAQFGLPYGIANKTGQPTGDETGAILDLAVAEGITTIDTARAYGAAEERIGRWRASRGASGVRVVTKFPKVEAGTELAAAEAVKKSIERSRVSLEMVRLDLVLAHKATDLLRPGVADALSEAQSLGQVAAIGASCYEPEEALLLLERLPLAAIQIPMSIADQRFAKAGVIEAAAERGVTLFIRSVFLQGALLLTPAELPRPLALLKEPLARLDALAEEAGCSRGEMLLGVVRNRATGASLVIGIERSDQIAPHVRALRAPALPNGLSDTALAMFAALPQSVIDPRLWAKA